MSQRITHVSCGAFANESERRALDYLKQRLISDESTGTWLLLSNLTISLQNNTPMPHEIDLVAIGFAGVVVVEIKHWDRRFLETSANADALRAEAQKAQRKAQLLKGRLRNLPFIRELFIPAKFLFTYAERERYGGASNFDSLLGIAGHSLIEWEDLLGCKGQTHLNIGQINQVLKALDSAIPTASKPRMRVFGDYLDLEPLDGDRLQWRKTFRARKSATGDRVILHVYDLTAVNEPRAQIVAEREAEVLRRLQKIDCVPSIMESFQTVPGFAGEMCYFSYSDPLLPSIEKKSNDRGWGVENRIRCAQACFEQLANIHGCFDEAVLHRRISPNTVLVRSDNRPVFLGFEFARLPGAETVAGAAVAESNSDEYIAPELGVGDLSLASTKSDVYALSAVLKHIFLDFDGGRVEQIRKILGRGLADTPQSRPEAAQMAAALTECAQDSPVKPEPPPPATTPDLWDEATVRELNGRKYRIVQPLGKGSFGHTFKVEEVNSDGEPVSGPYVAKAIIHAENGAAACRAYGLVRAQTGGSALAGVLEVAPEWRMNEITALLKWVDGEPLDTFTGVLSVLFEDFGFSTFEDGLRQWIIDLLEGLVVLHKAGLVHGDVSARNIIVHESNVTLTDYDLSRREGEASAGGTTMYTAPELDRRGPITRSTDVYALAATLFHVAFEVSPFQHSRGLDKSLGLSWSDTIRESIPSLVEFLDKATNPNSSQRFATSDEALAFLTRAALTAEPVSAVDSVLQVPATTAGEFYEAEETWLMQLLQTHPASRYGNPETRGLDSDFARRTYVEGNLDHHLAQEIRDGAVKLVFLCGNAGDGKTAFLQNLAENLGAPPVTSSTRLWKIRTDNGITVRINLDGAASFEGRSAHEILTTFLKPVKEGVSDDGPVYMVAINDGPLLGWIETQASCWLTNQIEALLDDGIDADVDPRVRFINLNQRSLVGSVNTDGPIDPVFLNRLIEKMLGPHDKWKACSECVSQSTCPAWRSVQDLRDQDLGPFIRARLARLLQAVHQRGEIHITARWLRSALSFGFFGNDYCTEIHARPDLTHRYYWDNFFDPEAVFRQGELLEELTRLDPALDTHAQVDRLLMLDAPTAQEIGFSPERLLSSRRRRAFFTWTQGRLPKPIENIRVLDTGVLRRLDAFQSLTNPDARLVLRDQICDGISRMQDLPHAAFAEDTVPLLVTPRTATETLFWVSKPKNRFSLTPLSPAADSDIDHLHTQAVLTYAFANGHQERLLMSLTLFALLLDIHDGYQLTSKLSDDVFANLSIFSQRLAQEDERSLFAWNPSGSGVIRIQARMADREGRLLQQLAFEPAGVEGI